MAKLVYTPPRHKSSDVYVPRHLQECEFVFVNDTIRRPLTPTYIRGHSKYSAVLTNTLQLGAVIVWVQLAFIEKEDSLTGTSSDTSADSSEPSPEVQPDTTTPTKKQTKSGRKVTFPRKFKSYIYF